MLTLTNKNKPPNFTCLICDYNTSKKGNYNAHLLTAKHKTLTLPNKNKPDDNKSVDDIYNLDLFASQCQTETNQNKPKQANVLSCLICYKKYNSRAGLWLHKKKCIILQKENHYETPLPVDSTKLTVNTSVILDIIKENQEFKTLLIDQQKQTMELQRENNILMNKMVEITQNNLTVPTTTNNNTINNNQFNIQLFLNEDCKNAINFSDFINNIQVSDNDLENNAKMGFVEGVTKIIVDNLRLLELTNRPIHCTDVKRETIYVKEEDEWDKDNSKKVIQRGIQDITCKNMQQLVDWRENNPEYEDMDSEIGEKSIVMQQNSMAGSKREEYYPKIIKNIAKESIISNKSSLIKR